MQFQLTRYEYVKTIEFKNVSPLQDVDAIRYFKEEDLAGIFTKKEFRYSWDGTTWTNWNTLTQTNISAITFRDQPSFYIHVRYTRDGIGAGNILRFYIFYDSAIAPPTPVTDVSINADYLGGEPPAFFLNRDNHTGPYSDLDLSNLSSPGVFSSRIDTSYGTSFYFKSIEGANGIQIIDSSSVLVFDGSSLWSGASQDASIVELRGRLDVTDSSVYGLTIRLDKTDASVILLENGILSSDSSIVDLRGRLDITDASVVSLDASLVSLISSIASSDASIVDLRSRLDSTDSSVSELSGRLDITDSSLASLDTEVTSHLSSIDSSIIDLKDITNILDASIVRIDSSILDLYASLVSSDASITDLKNVQIINIGDASIQLFAGKDSSNNILLRTIDQIGPVEITMDGSTILIDSSIVKLYDTSLDSSILNYNTVGGFQPGVNVGSIDSSNYTEIIDKLLFPLENPILTDPSVVFTRNRDDLYEVDQNIGVTFTIEFDPGEIRIGEVVVANRVGSPFTYYVEGFGWSDSSTRNEESFIFVDEPVDVQLGINTFQGYVSYLEGIQPYDSHHGNYGSSYPAGDTSIHYITDLEGVYPIFASSTDIIGPTARQELVSMLEGNDIEIELAPETNGYKQAFDIPIPWTGAPTNRPLTGIQTKFTASDEYWGYQGGTNSTSLNYWTTSIAYHNIQGNSISYTRYTYNGDDRGITSIRLKF